MTDDDALSADRAGELQVAASRYEELLATGGAAHETLLNLAVLYWQATDPGIAAAQKREGPPCHGGPSAPLSEV